MPQLIVRELEPEVVDALRKSAAAQGHSAEEEHRQILRKHLLTPIKKPFKAVLASMPEFNDDHLFEDR